MKADENADGVLRLHNEKEIELILDNIVSMLAHVDGGMALSNSREELALGSKSICTIMKSRA